MFCVICVGQRDVVTDNMFWVYMWLGQVVYVGQQGVCGGGAFGSKNRIVNDIRKWSGAGWSRAWDKCWTCKGRPSWGLHWMYQAEWLCNWSCSIHSCSCSISISVCMNGQIGMSWVNGVEMKEHCVKLTKKSLLMVQFVNGHAGLCLIRGGNSLGLWVPTGL